MSTTAAQQDEALVASSTALLRSLSFAKVKFIRYLTLDVGGNVRCKVVPVDYLRKHPEKVPGGVAFVKVSIGGLPSYADHMLGDSGLTAAGTLHLRPDLATLRILPYAVESAVVLGSLHDTKGGGGVTTTRSDMCCRTLLQRVVDEALLRHNITFTVGVELEFVLFDVKTGRPVEHSNFAEMTLLNQQQAFVSAVYDALQQQDISIELLHSESAPGQMEIVLEYLPHPVRVADHVLLARETIKAVARQHGMKALFLPKVDATQAGNGCHVHVSLRDAATGRYEFAAADGSAADCAADATVMGPTGQSFVEGILQHLPSVMAVTMPTANSFRRVGPGCWTGSQASWAVDDKEAPLRALLADGTAGGRVEFKLCDSTANFYLALAALLAAGTDGVARGLPLRAPLLSSQPTGSPAGAGSSLPSSVLESLDLLEKNELLKSIIPEGMMKGYLAIRRAEAARAASMSLEDEVREALDRA